VLVDAGVCQRKAKNVQPEAKAKLADACRQIAKFLMNSSRPMTTHSDKILDQFTKQASLFQATHRSAEDAIHQALTVSGVTAEDVVLDVACGPGVLTCAFAKRAKHATGVDVTPTMLEQAKELQRSSQVSNVDWRLCNVTRLPFEAESFSMIISRYAFHHFEDPAAVLAEMARVATKGGRVVIIDSAPPTAKAAAFDHAELMRDPSHTKALTPEEIDALLAEQGLTIERRHLYAWEVTAESLLSRSFPAEGDHDKLLRMYESDVGVDSLAMNARRLDNVLHVTFPTLITVARKQ
jgi:ubiquinone/menaquinone biosynthesis C-methylase UbiE